MVLVQNKIVHLDILKEEFVCNLNSCLGACCWEGDYGAPIDEDEKPQIENVIHKLRPLLSKEANEVLDEIGLWNSYPEINTDGTPLLPDGSCAYLIKEENGMATCGFEKLYREGQSDFLKPISCHLYPIRVSKGEAHSFEGLQYDRWDICSAACSMGKKMKVPLFKFCKESLIRKYGESFYLELIEIAEVLKSEI